MKLTSCTKNTTEYGKKKKSTVIHYAIHYSLTEHYSFHKITVLFKGTVIFKNKYHTNSSRDADEFWTENETQAGWHNDKGKGYLYSHNEQKQTKYEHNNKYTFSTIRFMMSMDKFCNQTIRHVGYVSKFNQMTHSYFTSRWPWKWVKELFFHLLDISFHGFIITTHNGTL